MLTRRNFLRGLLSSVAAGALVKNGILRPEQVIAEPERRVFHVSEEEGACWVSLQSPGQNVPGWPA